MTLPSATFTVNCRQRRKKFVVDVVNLGLEQPITFTTRSRIGTTTPHVQTLIVAEKKRLWVMYTPPDSDRCTPGRTDRLTIIGQKRLTYRKFSFSVAVMFTWWWWGEWVSDPFQHPILTKIWCWLGRTNLCLFMISSWFSWIISADEWKGWGGFSPTLRCCRE